MVGGTYHVHHLDVRLLHQICPGVLVLVESLLYFVVGVANHFRRHLRGEEQSPEVCQRFSSLRPGGQLLSFGHDVRRAQPACRGRLVGPNCLSSGPAEPSVRCHGHCEPGKEKKHINYLNQKYRYWYLYKYYGYRWQMWFFVPSFICVYINVTLHKG